MTRRDTAKFISHVHYGNSAQYSTVQEPSPTIAQLTFLIYI
jgi:hypothetical protein